MRTEYTSYWKSLVTIAGIWMLAMNPIQAAEILLGDTTVCAGTTVQLEIVGDFATLSWTPSETLSCDNCPNPRATPSETTTYTATFEEGGIVQSLSITVTVPVLKPIDDLTVCLNTPITFDAGVEYEGFDYFWQPNNLFSCSDCPNPDLINTAPVTTTLVRYGVFNGDCSVMDSFELIILNADGPVVTVIEDARFCPGDMIELGGPADPGTLYSWTSSPAGFTSINSNPLVSPTATTEYYLEATRPGCAALVRDTVRAILSSSPVVNFTTDTYDICEGDTISITSGLTVEPDVKYRWSPDLSVEDSTMFNVRAFPTTTTEFVLTASKGVCEVKDTIDVNVTPIRIDIVEGDSIFICKGTAQALSVTGAPDPFATVWSPAANVSSATGQLVDITRMTGSYTIYATITNGMCTVVDSAFVSVDSLPPNMEIMPQDTTICEGDFVILRSPVFEPEEYPNLLYEWAPASGNFQSGDSLYNVVVNPTDTTMYVRTVTSGACIDSNLVTVNVQPVETITVLPMDTTVCAGESFQYQIVNTGLEDFMWMPGTGLSCVDCPDPMVTATTSAQFMIEATDNNGCPVMGSANLNVEQPPTLNFAGTGDICPGQTVILNNPAIPGATYSWTSNDPNFPDTNNPTPTANPTGNFSYTATISTPICIDPVTQTISLNIIPATTLTVTDNPTICPGDQITLTADAGGVMGTFDWSNGQTGPSIDVNPNVSTDYRVTFTNMCQTLSSTISVMIESPFSVGIVPNPARTTVNLGESIDLNLNTLLPADQIANIMWFENGSMVGGSSNSINVRPPNEGSNEYRIKVTTVNGCVQEGVIIIFAVVPGVVIPNAFTPNSDGLNDELNVVRIIGDVEVNNLIIYDRWGNKVFENADGGWDGTFNGKAMPSDVYVYIVELQFPDGTIDARRGEISLLR